MYWRKKIGASRDVITNIERELTDEPRPIAINAICEALKINKEWLVDGVGPMDKEANNEKVLAEINERAQKLFERK